MTIIEYKDLSLKEKSVFNMIEEEMVLLDRKSRNKIIKLLVYKWVE